MKYDYSKVEGLLIRALRKLETKKLIALLQRMIEAQKSNVALKPEVGVPDIQVLTKIIVLIKKDLRAIERENPEALNELGEASDKVSDLILHLNHFTWDDWNILMELKDKIGEVHDKVVTKHEDGYEQQIIEQNLDKLEEQGKFNFKVNKNWRSV